MSIKNEKKSKTMTYSVKVFNKILFVFVFVKYSLSTKFDGHEFLQINLISFTKFKCPVRRMYSMSGSSP